MNLKATFLISCVTCWFLNTSGAQEISHFEDFGIPVDSFLNGSDGSGGFTSGNVFLPNNYNPDFGSWSGWSLSNKTDTLTPGFMNQYSAITGGGFDNSSNYAVSFGRSIIRLESEAAGLRMDGLYITNSTYAYLSMRDGDMFSKKFGGATGNDPDFFLLTIRKYLNGELSQDSVDFYLADFRFQDNSQDYIVKDWTYLDLSGLGAADSLVFTLSSSDVGQFGMNTPAYFCVDNISTGNVTSTQALASQNLFMVYPNPTSDVIQISHELKPPLLCSFYNMKGQQVFRQTIQNKATQIDLHLLPTGTYVLVLQNEQLRAWEFVSKQ